MKMVAGRQSNGWVGGVSEAGDWDTWRASSRVPTNQSDMILSSMLGPAAAGSWVKLSPF